EAYLQACNFNDYNPCQNNFEFQNDFQNQNENMNHSFNNFDNGNNFNYGVSDNFYSQQFQTENSQIENCENYFSEQMRTEHDDLVYQTHLKLFEQQNKIPTCDEQMNNSTFFKNRENEFSAQMEESHDFSNNFGNTNKFETHDVNF
ncbi:hypothetical protein RBK84_01140, partial [Pseudomonas aeruginosa]|uniref:hypothetical protein n=1 Tax=Pseudomonas aeruginosa TaxID=287 RepID=UPI0027D3CE03